MNILSNTANQTSNGLSGGIILLIICGCVFVFGTLIYFYIYIIKPKQNDKKYGPYSKITKDELKTIDQYFSYENGQYFTRIKEIINDFNKLTVIKYYFIKNLKNDELRIYIDQNSPTQLSAFMVYKYGKEVIIEQIFKEENSDDYKFPEKEDLSTNVNQNLSEEIKENYEIKIKELNK